MPVNHAPWISSISLVISARCSRAGHGRRRGPAGAPLRRARRHQSRGDKRLAIVETLMVGPRQRLFIVRRDNVEHLVLSGPEGAIVIENGIRPECLQNSRERRRDPAQAPAALSRCCWRSGAAPCGAGRAAAHGAPPTPPGAASAAPTNGGLSIDLTGSGLFTDRMLQIVALITVLSHRAVDPHHDDQLCAHRGGAVAAAHRDGPAADPAQQRDRRRWRCS